MKKKLELKKTNLREISPAVLGGISGGFEDIQPLYPDYGDYYAGGGGGNVTSNTYGCYPCNSVATCNGTACYVSQGTTFNCQTNTTGCTGATTCSANC
jgi:hypothetical protein